MTTEAQKEAREALARYDEPHHPDTLDGENRAYALATALRALLDEASRAPQPTAHDVEALKQVISDSVGGWNKNTQAITRTTDAILAAGFRRAPAEPAVTDEMVERAVESRYPLLLTGTLGEYERRYGNYGEEVRAIHQAQAKADMRAALEAALTEGEKP